MCRGKYVIKWKCVSCSVFMSECVRVWVYVYVWECMCWMMGIYIYNVFCKCIYVYVCMIISMYVCIDLCIYICVYLYIHMSVGVHVCVSVQGWVLGVYLYLFVWSVACYSVSDSLVQSELGNGRSGFVLVVDPTQWQFEDRSMRWSGDPYQFVMWRLNGDSVPNCVISCECLLLYRFLYLPLSVVFICYLYYYMWSSALFYQFVYLYHFIWHQRP